MVLEASDYIGFAWRNHYDRLHLHTVKQHSALPHMPYPADYPTYVSRLQVVEYLERYAERFNIKPLFGQTVGRIERNPAGEGWRVLTEPVRRSDAVPRRDPTETEQFTAERVIVATGYNRIPNVPELPGQDDFRGILWHSREYRNGAPFRNENVLVVGMGNTGAARTRRTARYFGARTNQLSPARRVRQARPADGHFSESISELVL